jgi:DNA-binding CsgD family transcriptional regulator/PAS domain-containing protein
VTSDILPAKAAGNGRESESRALPTNFISRATRQHGKVLSAIETIYDAAARPDLWPQALAAIASVFDAKGTVLLYNRDDGSMTAIVSPGLEAALADYAQKWWRHDIRVQRGIEKALLSEVGVYTDRDIATPEELKTHPFYTEFLAKHDLGYFMGGSISPHPKVFAAMSVQGCLAEGPFSDEDIALLTVLGRHAEKALRLTIQLIEAEATNLSLGEALSRLRSGVVVINENWQVLFCNDRAKRLMQENLLPTDWRPAAVRCRDKAALARVVSEVISNESPSDSQAILIGAGTRERPLVAYVLPVPQGSGYAAALVGARALVLLVDQQPGVPADPSLVRDLLNLTLGEARVASLVGSGQTPREAASTLGITEETTRTVLKRVYAKAGVSRQSELTAILARATLAAP